MDDTEYAAALKQELDDMMEVLETSRNQRCRNRIIMEHLEAERTSLIQQKEQRLARLELNDQVIELQKQLEEKRIQKQNALEDIVQAQRTLQEVQLIMGMNRLSSTKNDGEEDDDDDDYDDDEYNKEYPNYDTYDDYNIDDINRKGDGKVGRNHQQDADGDGDNNVAYANDAGREMPGEGDKDRPCGNNTSRRARNGAA